MQWGKDRVETVVNETGEYVREKRHSLSYMRLRWIRVESSAVGRVLAGFLRLLFTALKPAILIYGAAKLYDRHRTGSVAALELKRLIAERKRDERGTLLFQRKPIFNVTCQWAILPSSIKPRVSVTSNHRMLRTVLLARDNALRTASSIPFGEEPTISIFL